LLAYEVDFVSHVKKWGDTNETVKYMLIIPQTLY